MTTALWRRLRPRRTDVLIAASVLGGLFVTWLILTGLDTVMQFARQIGDIGQPGYGLGTALAYILLTVPRRAYQWFVFAALIGSLTGIGSLAATSELTALRASGLSRLRISLAVIGVVAILAAGVFVLGETAAPAGQQRAQAIQVQRHAGHLAVGGGSGLWARSGDTFINAKAALARVVHGQPTIELTDVRIFGFGDKGRLTSFRHARLATQQGQQWLLHDVRSTSISPDGISSTTRKLAPWTTGLDPKVLEASVLHPAYMSLRQLSRNITYLRANRQNATVYATAYWTRALYPINTLLLILCALPFAFGTLRSGGLGKRLFVGVLVAIAWYFLQRAIISTGTVFGLSPLLVNLIPTLLLLVIAVAYYRRA